MSGGGRGGGVNAAQYKKQLLAIGCVSGGGGDGGGGVNIAQYDNATQIVIILMLFTEVKSSSNASDLPAHSC